MKEDMKQELSCRELSEVLMECARRQFEPGASLSSHLAECEDCRDRWAAERRLAAGLRALRQHSAGARSPRSLRNTLMEEFAARQEAPAKVRPISRPWIFGLAAAAVILLSTVVVRDLTVSPAGSLASGGLTSGNQASGPERSEQSDAQQDGFIEVPYAPPLAPGELIRVVHTELQPAALASLGVNVDPSWNTELPADLLVGQDGFPRAVRISDEYAGVGGF